MLLTEQIPTRTTRLLFISTGFFMVDHSRRSIFSGKRITAQTAHLPWLISSESFFERCVRCSKCGDHCPTGIISPGDGGYPQVNFTRGECTFCYRCAEVCPEHLFKAQSSIPWVATITLSADCLPLHNIDCRACEESCDSGAIVFRPQLGRVAQPNIDTDLCNGCGACLALCPASAPLITLQESPS
ncbi:ferredoxin-type protein NapF [Shewanella sp. GXUN23E]|uniref:ferredoxin-type protein NapF n=1 Tax=Shewanella sp. GXUN23E TaxID=3422498 RepID=UPI003D7EEAE1